MQSPERVVPVAVAVVVLASVSTTLATHFTIQVEVSPVINNNSPQSTSLLLLLLLPLLPLLLFNLGCHFSFTLMMLFSFGRVSCVKYKEEKANENGVAFVDTSRRGSDIVLLLMLLFLLRISDRDRGIVNSHLPVKFLDPVLVLKSCVALLPV